ncbi:MAG: hypothetical protein HZA53_13235 [Planctomycetes bacterium]|nr:hypothetical protein [Planctomycetota bacterium]
MSSRTLLPVAIVLAVLAAIAFLVATRGDDRNCTLPQPSGHVGERATPAAELERESAAPALARAEPNERANAVTAPPEDRGVIVRAEDGVVVRVVLASSGAPVPGARVRGLGLLERRKEPDADAPLPVGVLDPEAELGDTPVYVTDAAGTTRVPKKSLPADYSATAGELWGKAYVSDSVAPPFTIELVPDATVRVQVVDAHGKPRARQEVALGCASAPRDDFWSALTDDRGFVEIRHAAALAAKCLGANEAVLRPVLFARDELLPHVALDIERGLATPEQLVLPPLGRVEVTIRTPDGAPLLADDVVLSRAEDEGYDGQPRWDADLLRPDSVDGARAVFEDIGLGVELRASSREVAFRPVHVLGTGPRHDDETVRLQITVDRARPVLTGRLLDPQGTPLRRVRAWLLEGRIFDETASEYVADPELRSKECFETDLEGRFRVRSGLLRDPRIDDRLRVRIVYRGADGRHELDTRLPSTLESPEHSLGDLRFAPKRPIGRCRVYDERGSTLVDARLRARFLNTEGVNEEWWVDPSWVRVEGGARELSAEFRGQRVMVVADAPGYEASEPVELVPNGPELRIVLGSGGWAVAKLLGKSGFELDRCVPMFVRPEFDLEKQLRRGIALQSNCARDADGALRFAAARAGRFDFVVLDAREGSVLERIGGIEFRSGVACDDPRLSGVEVGWR